MKPLTAQHLFNILSQLKKEGHDLSKITINYRTDSDSDVEVCTFVGEDLYDADTNSTLESLVLMADASDY
jgi:hypothetical protein